MSGVDEAYAYMRNLSNPLRREYAHAYILFRMGGTIDGRFKVEPPRPKGISTRTAAQIRAMIDARCSS